MNYNDLMKVAKDKIKAEKEEIKKRDAALREEKRQTKIAMKKEIQERNEYFRKENMKTQAEKDEIVDATKTILKKASNLKDSAYTDSEIFIEKKEDGNIHGKYKDFYFFTYQAGGTTKFKLLKRGTDILWDGDHYSPRETVPAYLVTTLKFKAFRRLEIDGRHNEAVTADYYDSNGRHKDYEYEKYDNEIKDIDSKIKTNNIKQ